MPSPELFIGLMSGTSADSIDAVLVDFTSNGAEIVASTSTDISQLKPEIRALSISGDNEIHRMGQLDRALGHVFAEAANELICQQRLSPSDITAIGSHGQTIRHFPPDDSEESAYSLQIGDPNTIAQLTGVTTVADFRKRDIVLGGQGAPLVPAFHQAVFERPGFPRAIINIGGIANVTLLPGDGSPSSVIGFDTGPGNLLMDSWVHRHQDKPYDDAGQWAAQGTVNTDLLNNLLATPYLKQASPKSTGPELFNLHWLDQHLEQFPAICPTDIQATLLEFTAKTITDALSSQSIAANEVFFCGGGTFNTVLMQRLETLLHPKLVGSTTQLGIPPEWVEAVAFAWLAKQTLGGKPGNAPNVTGASSASVLGAIYPA